MRICLVIFRSLTIWRFSGGAQRRPLQARVRPYIELRRREHQVGVYVRLGSLGPIRPTGRPSGSSTIA